FHNLGAARARRARRVLHIRCTGISTARPQARACARVRRLVDRAPMHQTNVDRALAALEEKFADDPERSTLVRLSRRFKASWLELAEALTEVKRHKAWERWGHDSFESYTKGELKLLPSTVEKLTGSYMFLNKRAPEVLTRDPLDAP